MTSKTVRYGANLDAIISLTGGLKPEETYGSGGNLGSGPASGGFHYSSFIDSELLSAPKQGIDYSDQDRNFSLFPNMRPEPLSHVHLMPSRKTEDSTESSGKGCFFLNRPEQVTEKTDLDQSSFLSTENCSEGEELKEMAQPNSDHTFILSWRDLTFYFGISGMTCGTVILSWGMFSPSVAVSLWNFGLSAVMAGSMMFLFSIITGMRKKKHATQTC